MVGGCRCVPLCLSAFVFLALYVYCRGQMEGGFSTDGGSSSLGVCLCHLLYESFYGIPDLFTIEDRKLCCNICR